QHPKLTEAIDLAGRGEIPSSGAIEALAVSSKAAAFACAEVEAYTAAQRRLLKELRSVEHGHVYEGIRDLLGLFAARYAELKDERSGLDFEDLQLEAVRLLRETAVGDRYRERFRHLLIDEFQDTNRLQLALVESLRGPETVVFTVGDEFQSIYGFRHADLDVFRAERARIDALPDERGEVLPLSGNFRSAAGVLGGINWLGKALLPDFRPLDPGEAATDPGSAVRTELLVTPCASGDANPWRGDDDPFRLKRTGDDATAEHRVAEARYLAARLRRLHVEEGVPLGDIVVLLRGFTHVGAFEDELERAGLRPYIVGGRGYWSQQQVDDVRQMLGAIANPLDDPSLLGALAAPFCGVSPDTLWLLRQAAGDGRHIWPVVDRGFAESEDGAALLPVEPDGQATLLPIEPEGDAVLAQIPPEDAQRLRQLRARLVALRAEAPLMPLEELVDRSVRDFDYDLASLSRPGGDRRLANIRKLMRLARSYEAAEGRDLRGFLDYLGERAGSFDRPEGQAATHAEAHEGVRVMTVHAAKGLEFPVVAVADLGRKLGGRLPDLLIGRPPEDEGRVGVQLARIAAHGVQLFDYAELREATTAAEVAEDCRLAYVAASRAQQRLILSGCFSQSWQDKPVDERPLTTPIVERLLEARAGAPTDLVFDENEPDRERFAALTAAAESDGETAEIVALAAAPAQPPAESIARHLSYSSISTYENCGYRFYAERMLGIGSARDLEQDRHGGGRAFGNAVHSLLELAAQEGWQRPPRPRVEAILRAEGIDDEAAAERAETMVCGWLDSPLGGEVREAGGARAEVPFLLPAAAALVRGKIDLLAEPAGGGILVVDYKTNRLEGAEPASMMSLYEEQRRIYALAAAGIGSAAEPRSVRTAYVFLERPDEPVVLDFDAEAIVTARRELEALIERIAAADFSVTERPHFALCHDCPARENLCSHPPEATLAKLPA
ncbi:MAG: hypothetical protein QOG09_554, partial [Solirubrobacterales bacterium]|nr:hypothetical protein [Solirubrobacterales bacterium]